MNQDLPGPSHGAQPQQAEPQQAAAVDPTPLTATPMPKTKEWHNLFGIASRNFLIRTLVDDLKEIFPPGLSPVPGMQQVNYARMIESDVYQEAENRIDYIVKLVEKIYVIKQEYKQQQSVRAQQERDEAQGPIKTFENKQKIKISVSALEHACVCQASICFTPCCNRMKGCLAHVNECRFKTRGGCAICRQFMAVCCLHSKYCTTGPSCPVKFCNNLKSTVKMERKQFVLRRMAEIITSVM